MKGEYELFVVGEEESLMTAGALDQMQINHVMLALGLVGEAGELANKVKKLYRGHGATVPMELQLAHRAEIMDEAGDVLWYLTRLMYFFGYDLSEVMQHNVRKLRQRRAQKTGETSRPTIG